jgi:hypothetical protein
MLALCCLHLINRALQSERGHLPESLTLLACSSPGHRRMTEGLTRAGRCMSFLTFVLLDVSRLSSSASLGQLFWPSVSSTHVLKSSICRRARRMSSHGRTAEETKCISVKPDEAQRRRLVNSVSPSFFPREVICCGCLIILSTTSRKEQN